ncbi:MAG: Riboflavin biosynthesis protein RibF [Candidatus Roizmanbacteria bacterium GW2011_GWA2_35_8]|uniref:riboflavin kinase n=1 Tax=Candidatus Roizmanbacteria bacterium GW2011_GWA2_35_8 TaxID=1618479 RepID=A0A0G0CWP0_9BACT|nr:MAG: Riboflavin biosynthesis protein RibF [Candidatus Roizmanbacteria bacterium GW2011_GWA2_35_8]
MTAFTSRQIKGRGRARKLGYPTINLEIPKNFDLKDGVYGVEFMVDTKKYLGAMHFGPSPTFADTEKTLEVFLINLKNETTPVTKNKMLKIKVLKYLREILSFSEKGKLIKQIANDIQEIKSLK